MPTNSFSSLILRLSATMNMDAHPEAPIRPLRPMSASSFDSSMALTLLFLLTVLLFLGFFSIYIPCFSRRSSAQISRRSRRCRHDAYQRAASKARALPVFTYGASDNNNNNNNNNNNKQDRPMECAICLAEFEERETVRMIPYCGHVFHQQCIDAWFYSNVSCPLCRSTQLFKAESSSSSSSSPPPLDAEDLEIGCASRGAGSAAGEVGLRRTSSCASSSFSGEVLLSMHRSSSF